MILYAESSAVLAWLLGEAARVGVAPELSGAEVVFASDLTLVGCDRALIRAVHDQRLSEAGAAGCRASLNEAAAGWVLLEVSGDVVERARRTFPVEPVRALDALHLASALVARSTVSDVALLSLDDRVRRSGRELGFELLPPV